jgi:AraC-like DNA-binding protein
MEGIDDARHFADSPADAAPPCPPSADGGAPAGRANATAFYDRMPVTLGAILDTLTFVMPLLDVVPNVVFFVKDLNARYVAANLTLATRCGLDRPEDLLGKTSEQVFPSKFGRVYTEQDQDVIRHARTISDQLELHLYPDRESGWCMTHKRPICDGDGRVVGLVGISCDLQAATLTHPAYARLAGVDDFLRANLSRTIPMSELTAMTGLSISQFERHCKRIFHLTPRQMLHKFRLERATELLATTESITNIAAACGYSDHSAFSRHFKSMTGISPSQFRLAQPKAPLEKK